MEHFDEKIIQVVNVIKEERQQAQEAEKFQDQLREVMEGIRAGKVVLKDHKIETEKKLLFQKSFSIYIPQELRRMADNVARIKYPSEARPQIIYTNKKDTVNIGINYSQQELENDEVSAFRDVMKDSFLSVNPSSEILDSGELMVGETNVAYYTFPNFVIGGRLYNLIFVLSLKGKALVCNMNCIKKDMKKWELFFYGVMNTIEIHEEG